MKEDSQIYEVSVKFKYVGKVFEGDPDDVYDLAEFERDDIEQLLLKHFDECNITNLKVDPIITPGK